MFNSPMRRAIRLMCLVAAVALIGYGMIQPVERDARWLAALWLAALPLLVAVRLMLPPLPRGPSRSILYLGVFIAVGFGLLSLQLLRQQFIRADAIYAQVYVDPQTGQVTSNVRPVIASQRVQRGKIIDRNGTVLADTRMTDGGFAHRVYPLGEALEPAALGNVLGYFSHRYGQTGLEYTYGDYLSGERDAFGRLSDTLLGRPQVGDDLRLTLDARLQQAARTVLGGRTGSIVVLDPASGAVLAMASAPGFDPAQLAFNPAAPDRDAENERISAYWQRLNSEDAGQPLLNRPTQGRYPPGSTFKTVTAVGVLEHPNQGRPDDIRCLNELETEPGAPPVVNAVPDLASLTGDPSNLERVYAFSCNVAFAQYALRLGAQLMEEVAGRFDIYRPQDAPESYPGFTDLPADASTLYADPGFLNRPAGLADTGYGQGQIQVTPLQMAMVAAAVANDGVLMRPYLVDKVTRPDGSIVIANGPRAIRRAMSRETAARMRANMRAVVAYGFGRPAQAVDPSVAVVGGKSGTAEHGPGTTPHAWFIAIAPVERPRYAVAVMIENGGEGSRVAAAAAGQVLAAAFELEK
jgi:peptidoglycan glycosyltransferase